MCEVNENRRRKQEIKVEARKNYEKVKTFHFDINHITVIQLKILMFSVLLYFKGFLDV
jgi:GTP cyclohydrolase III